MSGLIPLQLDWSDTLVQYAPVAMIVWFSPPDVICKPTYAAGLGKFSRVKADWLMTCFNLPCKTLKRWIGLQFDKNELWQEDHEVDFPWLKSQTGNLHFRQMNLESVSNITAHLDCLVKVGERDIHIRIWSWSKSTALIRYSASVSIQTCASFKRNSREHCATLSVYWQVVLHFMEADTAPSTE